MCNTKTLTIEKLIDKSLEKTYFEVPFSIPSNVSKIEVCYSYKRRDIKQQENGDILDEEINIIDLAIMDESKSFRGWSGSERLYFYITENEATPGYIKGTINEGKWALILGAYKVQEEGCLVNINIKFTLKERVLLKGDLHTHSLHSDGRYDVENVINLAKLHGLDFIFLTDHNTFSQNDYIKSSDSLVVMPGMEWTHYRGHCNFLGVRSPIKNFVANDKEKVIEIMEEARNSGALITLNHPFDKGYGWRWGFDVPYDVVEVWNGPMKNSEIDAVEWWNSKLVEGERIPIVGGSDSHKNEMLRMVGAPSTFLYCDSKGPTDIIRAIRNGHCFISYISNGPTIELTIGDAIMGDCVNLHKEDEGLVKVCNAKFNDEIRLISDKGIEKNCRVSGESTKTLRFNVEDRKFYRVEVWREVIPENLMLSAISNPIYIRR